MNKKLINRAKKNNLKNKQRGITLIQIMAILGVLGVILAVSTTKYLNHQFTHDVNLAFKEATIAKQVVARSAAQPNTADVKDWSEGYTPSTAPNQMWSVRIEPSSAVVQVQVQKLGTSRKETLLWIPLKAPAAKAQATSAQNELEWACVTREAQLPIASESLVPLPKDLIKANFDEEILPEACR